MNYIIDGHNLIGKIDDIDLRDPDDEAKLILRLINWAAIGKNRRVIVVFDGGNSGQHWHQFKSDLVKPIFVRVGDTADRWIIEFMNGKVKDRNAFHIITSDHEIIKVADNRRIAHTISDKFAEQIAEERRTMSQLGQERVEPPRHKMNETDVDLWLQMFGGEKEIELKPYQPRLQKPEPEPDPEPEPLPQTNLKDHKANPSAGLLPDHEVEEWLNLFGGEQVIFTIHEPSSENKGKTRYKKGTTKKLERPANAPIVEEDSILSQEDSDLWHAMFGDDSNKD